MSATDQASSSIRYAWLAAVDSAKLYHTIHTWITRVTTCNAVVFTGDLMMPEIKMNQGLYC